MSRDTIGVISGVYNLRFNIKFSEPSEMSFSVPQKIDGAVNPLYESISGFKIIYTNHYGVYLVMNPATESDGINTVKNVTGYSLEKTLDFKKFYLEEGTFNFWDPSSPSDTLIGRVLEIATGWSIGYISPSLIGRYRTFDSYDEYLLSFLYNTAPEKYRCVFVFDPYAMTINAYDADEERPSLPIYLDYDNLLQEINVNEISDELCTALRPYGADDLSIRDVNPIGTNWIYDLSYFISTGDIPTELADKWGTWQKTILSRQPYYKGLVGLRSSASAELIAAQAALEELNNELENLTNQQSVTIQALALETTEAGKASQQRVLDRINGEISDKKEEIAEKEEEIEKIEELLDPDNPQSYAAQIQSIVNELAIDRYFSEDEYAVLSNFFQEQDITESTFVATDVDTAVSGKTQPVQLCTAAASGSSISKIDLQGASNHSIYSITGGSLSISGDLELHGDIVRGTLEVSPDNSFVMSIYTGSLTYEGNVSQSGLVVISGSVSRLSSDIQSVTEDDVTEMKGTQLQLSMRSASVYITSNVSDYQRYSVEMELYDYAVKVLGDLATPTYEFTVSSANFLFANEFAAFRNKLELGKGIYLHMDDGRTITPLIIELEFDFEDPTNFSMVFSNRFKRHDSVNTLKDMIESGYSAGRDFDASKYVVGQTVDQASRVSKFMSSSLDAAVNAIVGASNQSVVINGAGIQVGGSSKYQLRIIDSMIAITDDNWQSAKLAIGRFASEETGEYFGVNADVLGGKITITNNLIVENQQVDENNNPTGVIQFRVDSTGAWLNNATFLLQKDSGGKILLDPRYGIAAGNGALYTNNGTVVFPSFVDSDGEIILDKDGFPQNANLFFDLRDGSAYFRGNVYAEDGVFNGTVYATDGVFNGTVYATDGEFSGTLKATTLSGELKGDPNSVIKGISLDIGNGNFVVDSNGNVTMNGNISYGSANIPIQYQYSPVENPKSYQISDTMRDTDKFRRESICGGAWSPWYQFRGTDGENGEDANIPDYIHSTYIGPTTIESPTITGNQVRALGRFEAGTGSTSNFRCTGYMGAGYGLDASGTRTYGVALSSSDDDQNIFMIVTNAGVRMTAGNHQVVVTENSIHLTYSSNMYVSLRSNGIRLSAGSNMILVNGNGIAIASDGGETGIIVDSNQILVGNSNGTYDLLKLFDL